MCNKKNPNNVFSELFTDSFKTVYTHSPGLIVNMIITCIMGFQPSSTSGKSVAY